MTRKTAVLVCPGRGTYNRSELGYLGRHHADKSNFIEAIDHYRRRLGQAAIADLDAMDRYSMALHNIGENVSALIYACALCDIADINQERFEIVAITGNSMGWYLALAAAQALDADGAIHVVNTMGAMLKDGIVGTQIVYPVVDADWRMDAATVSTVRQLLNDINHDGSGQAYLSIDLGGVWVLGADAPGSQRLLNELPPKESFPLTLPNHAAFHTPLLQHIADKAQQPLKPSLFQRPEIPLVDGRGHIWQPYATDINALHHYTFEEQVCRTYDFSKALEVALKEFAPDKIIVPGPGYSLGAPIAQELIKQQWLGLACKQDFVALQKQDPFVLCMGLEEQRKLVI